MDTDNVGIDQSCNIMYDSFTYFMRERVTPPLDIDVASTDLSVEQRILHKQRVRTQAAIEKLEAELIALSHEQLSCVDRVLAMGRRARIHTALHKLRLDLWAIGEREESESNYLSYLAPIELAPEGPAPADSVEPTDVATI